MLLSRDLSQFGTGMAKVTDPAEPRLVSALARPRRCLKPHRVR